MHRLDSRNPKGTGPWLPPVVGHRGAAGEAPENTLAGLRRAHSLGCKWVEFDVRITADGELILLHDDRLERTTDGRGRARELPLAAIRRFDAGAWFDPLFVGESVPTLTEAIAVLAELGLGANIELKSEPGDAIATALAATEILSRSWPRHLPAPLVSSFSDKAVEAAHDHAPGLARGLLMRSVTATRQRRAAELGCMTINVDHQRLRRSIVTELREAGYFVMAYTVNDVVRARELWQWGVSSVFSDFPQIMNSAVTVDPVQPETRPLRSPVLSRRDVLL
jgi:glycerophosphoryl diester phosphodiesterase